MKIFPKVYKKAALKNVRSSRPEVFCKKGVLRNFAKFTGKHLCKRLFFNKVAGVKFLRTPFFIEHLWWLLQRMSIFQHTQQIY